MQVTIDYGGAAGSQVERKWDAQPEFACPIDLECIPVLGRKSAKTKINITEHTFTRMKAVCQPMFLHCVLSPSAYCMLYTPVEITRFSCPRWGGRSGVREIFQCQISAYILSVGSFLLLSPCCEEFTM